jgi:predicted transcriptional regulator
MAKTMNEKHTEMMNDPEYAKHYKEQEEEFSIARELIRARTKSGLTQEEVARRMGTTQSAVARMESGKPLPSIRSLKRYAQATASKVKISLET